MSVKSISLPKAVQLLHCMHGNYALRVFSGQALLPTAQTSPTALVLVVTPVVTWQTFITIMSKKLGVPDEALGSFERTFQVGYLPVPNNQR